jgi:hypothetical protein
VQFRYRANTPPKHSGNDVDNAPPECKEPAVLDSKQTIVEQLLLHRKPAFHLLKSHNDFAQSRNISAHLLTGERFRVAKVSTRTFDRVVIHAGPSPFSHKQFSH